MTWEDGGKGLPEGADILGGVNNLGRTFGSKGLEAPDKTGRLPACTDSLSDRVAGVDVGTPVLTVLSILWRRLVSTPASRELFEGTTDFGSGEGSDACFIRGLGWVGEELE